MAAVPRTTTPRRCTPTGRSRSPTAASSDGSRSISSGPVGRTVVALLVLHGLAALAGLVVPRFVGRLVDDVSAPGTTLAQVDALALGVAAVVVVQAVLTFLALRTSVVFGQDLLASAREYVVDTVLGLPLGRVESASSGDLVTRVTRDVSTMSQSVRYGLPEAAVALAATILTVGAMLVNSVLLAVPLMLSAPVLVRSVRRYLRRAAQGYVTEGGTYSLINTSLTETVEGARTVEALGLQSRRNGVNDADIAESSQAERYTMTLRNVLFGALGVAFDTPLVFVLALGALGFSRGWVTLGQLTAATLYVQALREPLQRLIRNLDQLQVGIASTARLLGVAEVPQDREAGDRLPDGNRLVGSDLRFAYRPGRDVLHGVDLTLRPGERLAIVGPSGSGKSTLGRLLAGINGPRTGSVTVGGVELLDLPLPVLRTEVALVTQEHHVFAGLAARQRRAGPRGRLGRGRGRGAAHRGGARLGAAAAARAGHPARVRPARADPGPGAADRPGPPGRRRPAHAGARRGDLADRPDHSAAPRGVDGARCWRTGRSSRSPTACTPRTTPTASPSSSTGASPSSAATTSWSSATASTPACGAPGRAEATTEEIRHRGGGGSPPLSRQPSGDRRPDAHRALGPVAPDVVGHRGELDLGGRPPSGTVAVRVRPPAASARVRRCPRTTSVVTLCGEPGGRARRSRPAGSGRSPRRRGAGPGLSTASKQ